MAHVHADGYAELLRRLPGVELVGFTEADPELAAAFGRTTGLPAFADPQALAGQVDGALICSENAARRALVETAAAAGVHVLCEKPLATTLQDAQAMQAACEAGGVRFMTAFPMRYAPPALALRARLQAGQLGPLLAVSGVNHSESPARHRAWFADPQAAGGGAVMDHVVHLADLLRWMQGQEIGRVFAQVRTRPSAPSDTHALLLLTLQDGLNASIDPSWSRPAGYPRWGHLRMEVVGERATAVMDAFAEHLTLYPAGEPGRPAWLNYGLDANLGMLQAFVAMVRGAPSPITWNDGYQAMRVALAAYASQQQGQPVLL
ncbi:Gfo/Idh/MocA family protein [Deinococcus sonorensis]|uniref:Gfo/Idh/MocA family oxidoreductase n=1 Tax=Deinococcus sonorensis KR-87 TaxID=694439 RepID=A0AAU7UB46_9DEIO